MNRSVEPYQCELDQSTHRIVTFILAIVCLPLHGFLCLAMFLYRANLRRKVTNIFAVNVVIAHFVSNTIRLIISTTGLIGHSPISSYNYNDGANAFYVWFALRNIYEIMFLVIPLSIGLLIQSLQRSLFQIHRNVSGLSNTTIGNRRCSKNVKRNHLKRLQSWILIVLQKRNTKLLIFLNWFIPVFFAMVTTFRDTDCLENCICLFEYVPLKSNVNERACPTNRTTCNVFWAPSSDYTNTTITILWILLIILNIFLLSRAFFKYATITSEYKISLQKSSVLKKSSPNDTTGVEAKKEATAENERNDFNKVYMNVFLLNRLKRNLLFLVLIAVIFVAGSGAAYVVSISVSITLHHSDEATVDEATLVFVDVLPILSEIVNSFLLCVAISDLKSSVLSFISWLYCCSDVV